MMAFVDIEDLYGTVETVVFPNVYERCQEVLNEDNVVAMKGKLNFKEGEIPKVLADNVMMLDDPEVDTIARYNAGRGYGNSYGGSYAVPEETHTEPSQPVKVRIPQDMEESDALQKIKEVLMKYPGNTPVYIYLKSGRTICQSSAT